MNEISTASIPKEKIEQREQKIVSAAIELFAEFGFHSTSTRKIAKVAGVSESTIFHYFKSKDGLLVAILDRFYADLASSSRACIKDQTSTYDRLLFIALNHVERISARNALMMRLIHTYFIVDLHWHEHIKSSPLHSFNRRYTAVFDDVVSEGITRGELKSDLDIHAFRDMFFGSLEYAMRTTLIHKNEFSERDYITSVIDDMWLSYCAESQQAETAHSQADLLNSTFKRLNTATRKLEKLVKDA